MEGGMTVLNCEHSVSTPGQNGGGLMDSVCFHVVGKRSRNE